MTIKQLLVRCLPARLEVPLRYRFNHVLGRLEYELTALNRIVTRRRRCVDVGANVGLYTYRLSQLFQEVEAFEPNPSCARMLEAAELTNVNVHDTALSNASGRATLSMPDTGAFGRDTALASISNRFGNGKSVPVELRTLDEYEFTDVDLIKIDVEGHEREVLEGARQTILNDYPTLLIEIEQRHHPDHHINDIFRFIESLGYSGWFYYLGEPKPIEEFSVMQYQQFVEPFDRDEYVNNFVFRPLSGAIDSIA